MYVFLRFTAVPAVKHPAARFLLLPQKAFLPENLAKQRSDEAPPDGIEHKHIHEAHGSRLRRWPFGLFGLSLLLVLAFFGTYGGYTTLGASGNDVRFTVDAPDRIRNGEFFEMRIRVATDERGDVDGRIAERGTRRGHQSEGSKISARKCSKCSVWVRRS